MRRNFRTFVFGMIILLAVCFLLASARASTYIISSEQLNEGVEKIIANNDKIRFSINGEDYFFELLNSSADNAVASLTSFGNLSFNLKEQKPFDLDSNGQPDLFITLDISSVNRSGFLLKTANLTLAAQTVPTLQKNFIDLALEKLSFFVDFFNAYNFILIPAIVLWIIIMLILIVFMDRKKPDEKIDAQNYKAYYKNLLERQEYIAQLERQKGLSLPQAPTELENKRMEYEEKRRMEENEKILLEERKRIEAEKKKIEEEEKKKIKEEKSKILEVKRKVEGENKKNRLEAIKRWEEHELLERRKELEKMEQIKRLESLRKSQEEERKKQKRIQILQLEQSNKKMTEDLKKKIEADLKAKQQEALAQLEKRQAALDEEKKSIEEERKKNMEAEKNKREEEAEILKNQASSVDKKEHKRILEEKGQIAKERERLENELKKLEAEKKKVDEIKKKEKTGNLDEIRKDLEKAKNFEKIDSSKAEKKSEEEKEGDEEENDEEDSDDEEEEDEDEKGETKNKKISKSKEEVREIGNQFSWS